MPVKLSYETVIGLEVHARLLTRSKMFCSDINSFGAAPNSQTSVVSLAHPGTLPVLNREAIQLAICLGLACNCDIAALTYFARKNYFYPDLPKGYQISQHTAPICRNGFLEIHTNGENKKIRINHIHLEEDAGKSMHGADGRTLVDYNRAGVPLLEIVTEPDLGSAEEAANFVTAIRMLVKHLGVCDGSMEKGSLRCDVNISLRPRGDTELGTKVEIKNLNSLRFIRKAIAHEEERLAALLDTNQMVQQQTRGFNEENFTTYAIRTKEDEDDYRYFPEPDLPPVYITEEMKSAVKKNMPALPADIKARLQTGFSLPEYDAAQISADLTLAGYFIETVKHSGNPKATANWLIGPVRNYLHEGETENEPVLPEAFALAEMIRVIDEGLVSYGMALKEIFPKICAYPRLNVREFIIAQGLSQKQPEAELDTLIADALKKHAHKIPEFRKGKKGLVRLFVGEVMRASGGKADAEHVTNKIIEKLNEIS